MSPRTLPRGAVICWGCGVQAPTRKGVRLLRLGWVYRVFHWAPSRGRCNRVERECYCPPCRVLVEEVGLAGGGAIPPTPDTPRSWFS